MRSAPTPLLMVAFFVVVLGLFTILPSCNGEDDEESEFCALARETFGNPTQNLGERCTEGGNTGCSQTYHNCIQGDCVFSEAENHEICTLTCTSNADCSGSTPFCSDGICQPGADCGLVCDEALCCDYDQDPNDPTQCVQTRCFEN